MRIVMWRRKCRRRLHGGGAGSAARARRRNPWPCVRSRRPDNNPQGLAPCGGLASSAFGPEPSSRSQIAVQGRSELTACSHGLRVLVLSDPLVTFEMTSSSFRPSGTPLRVQIQSNLSLSSTLSHRNDRRARTIPLNYSSPSGTV